MSTTTNNTAYSDTAWLLTEQIADHGPIDANGKAREYFGRSRVQDDASPAVLIEEVTRAVAPLGYEVTGLKTFDYEAQLEVSVRAAAATLKAAREAGGVFE